MDKCESKITLTDRLRAEGRWAEASRFKDGVVKELRTQGMKRAEAAEEAWARMAAAFAPVKPDPDEVAMGHWLADAVVFDTERWAAKHGVTLSTEAMTDLWVLLALAWQKGREGFWPGPNYPQDRKQTRWARTGEEVTPLLASGVSAAGCRGRTA